MNYTLYKYICFVCIKETSPRDVSLTQMKHMVTDKNHIEGGGVLYS